VSNARLPPTNGATPPAELTLASFAVPPRFADATFASYEPDPAFPTQAAAVARLRAALSDVQRSAGGWLARWRKRSTTPAAHVAEWKGLYLDGSFGVGKTHLLAAAYHAFAGSRAYLSFQDLTYVVGALGMREALDIFSQAQLICLDEFELDDPGNTMLATSFVAGALARGARLIVTSNTLPAELGQGRFSAAAFQREIGQLAAVFESLPIEGDDYRHRRYAPDVALPRLLPSAAAPSDALPWLALLDQLAQLHPVRYVELVERLGNLRLRDVQPIAEQDQALRFVHFIDKLYDRCRPMTLYSDFTLAELFPPSYGYGGFQRKFRRCQSRLHETLSEPLPVTRDSHAVARGT
jgi:cell division protein ZapE